MKKYDLLKVLGITLLVVALISWVVPAGYYSNGTYTSLESILPIGLYDLFRLPVVSIVTFIQYGLLFLAIGGFYGVLNRTGAYSKLIDKINSKFKNKKLFLTITTILFAVLASVIGSLNLIFVLVPLFIAVLIKMGYSKLTSFAATIGAMLVGQIGTTLGFSTWGYFKYFFSISMFDLILVRTILFIMITTLYVILVRKNSAKEVSAKASKKKEDKIDIPLHEDGKSKKSFIPLIVMFAITFIFLAIGVYNWYYGYEIDFFANTYQSIITFEISNMPILKNLLGTISEPGFFGNYDIIVILTISSAVIGWIYSLKLSEIIEGFVNGLKEMIRPALYGMLACTIFTGLLNIINANSNSDFIATIINTFISGDKFNLSGTVGSALVSSFAYNDFYTLGKIVSGAFTTFGSTYYSIIAFVFTTMYSIVMLIAPTSIFLLAGLSYLEIPYKEWIKYIWKLLLIIFAITVVIAFIVM